MSFFYFNYYKVKYVCKISNALNLHTMIIVIKTNVNRAFFWKDYLIIINIKKYFLKSEN